MTKTPHDHHPHGDGRLRDGDECARTTDQCCERDHNHDGNCDVHAARGVSPNEQSATPGGTVSPEDSPRQRSESSSPPELRQSKSEEDVSERLRELAQPLREDWEWQPSHVQSVAAQALSHIERVTADLTEIREQRRAWLDDEVRGRVFVKMQQEITELKRALGTELSGHLFTQGERNWGLHEARRGRAMLTDLVEVADIAPEPSCSCNSNPPCPDCVEWGGLRDVLRRAKTLLNEWATEGDRDPLGEPRSPPENLTDRVRSYLGEEAWSTLPDQVKRMLAVTTDECFMQQDAMRRVGAERDKAIKSLRHYGYTDCGGELWKPPLGKNPLPQIDRLRAALERYGHHTHPGCHDLTLNEDGSFGPRNGCLCGFDAALSGEPSSDETSEKPVNCQEAGPGRGFCDMCAQGLYEQCRYLPQKASDYDDGREEIAPGDYHYYTPKRTGKPARTTCNHPPEARTLTGCGICGATL